MRRSLAALGIALAVLVATCGEASTRAESRSRSRQVHKVHVFYLGSVCYVNPAHLSVALGDTIVWTDLTKGNVTIFFPRSPRTHGRFEVISLQGGRSTTPLMVTSDKERGPGVYPYQAFCEATGTWAEGSHPTVIVNGE